MSRLFNRNWKAGFTLVELIVVIAILAILAGIAIPVYSGYIKKADKAADEQLLSAVNTAFAAACQENYINRMKLDNAELEVSDKCVIGVKNLSGLTKEGAVLLRSESHSGLVQIGAHPAQIAVDEAKITAAVNDSFKKYFGSNNGTPFRVYNNFNYDPSTGTFSGEAKASVLVAGYEWKYDAKTLRDAYNASSFSNNTKPEKLTGMMDSLSSALSSHVRVEDLANEPNFKEILINKLHINPETADPQTLSNAAVFFVAEQLGNLSSADLIDALKTDVSGDRDSNGNYNYSNLDNVLKLDPTSLEGRFVKTALLYGMATAYANSGWATEQEKAELNKTPTDLASAMNIVNTATRSDGWGNYLSFDPKLGDYNGTDDVKAFLQVMTTISGNEEGFNSLSGKRLFSSDEILAQITSMLGLNS